MGFFSHWFISIKLFSLDNFASEHDFHGALVQDKLRDMTVARPLEIVIG